MNKNIKKAFLLSCLYFFSFTSIAITVNPIDIEGTPDSLSIKSITVTNNSKHDEYVKILIYKILNPGTKKQQEILVKNSNKLELTVFPKVFKLSENDTETVRIIIPDTPVDSETLYRIRVIPGSEYGTGLTVNVSYGVLLRVIPDKNIYDISVERHSDKITISNIGNRRVHVNSPCKKLTKNDFRIYPNKKKELSNSCKIENITIKDDSGRKINITVTKQS